MSLLSRIRTWLRPTPAKPVPKKPQHAAETGTLHKTTTEPPVVADPTPPPLPPATGAVDSRVHVIVYYQDASSHEALLTPAHLYGHPGEPLPIAWRVVPGFVLTEIKGFVQVFPKSNQVIVCGYSARVAGPVVIYHRDTAGRLLQVPEILTGVINQPYTAHALSRFADAVQGESTQSGTFTPTSQRLRFTYQLTPLQTGALADATYVELLVPKLVYPVPLGSAPLPTRLPRQTYWQVYAVMRDPNTHTVWLNVGGNQWLTADGTRNQAHNPFLPDPTPLALPHSLFTSTAQKIELHGVALGDATRWSAPYAEMRPHRLATGTPVHIVAVTTLNNQSRWYRLADGDYVLATFITVLPHA